jgi:TolB-like protein
MMAPRSLAKTAVNPQRFFGELKRRNVYRVAIAYAVVGWLLIQVATQVFPFFDVPNWGVRLIVLVIVFCFPLALIFAWIFELTPEGLKRTEEVPPTHSITRVTGRKLDWAIICVLLAVIGVFAYQRFATSGRSITEATAPEKSIAVLPFKNLSAENENAFFAEGLQDDILTSLAKILALKVISRSSVMAYRGDAMPKLQEIAQSLGVSNLLEGTVRREKDRVLVNVELIDARTNRQIWAERYERALADVLTLQGELAGEIASALQATLSPAEKARVETKPTNNAEAYVLYLHAREYQTRVSAVLADLQTAEQLYVQALGLDANFALAHARLSETLSRIHHWFQPTEAYRAKARAEAEKSLQLQPNLSEGHVALALCFYWGAGDYAQALREFQVAATTLPNSSEIGLFTASIAQRRD